MALSSTLCFSTLNTTSSLPHFHAPKLSSSSHFPTTPSTTHLPLSHKWRTKVSFFPSFLKKRKDAKIIKEELLQAIAPLDRGADATLEDQQTVDQVNYMPFISCFLHFLIFLGLFFMVV